MILAEFGAQLIGLYRPSGAPNQPGYFEYDYGYRDAEYEKSTRFAKE
jgi:hypothetical protein